MNNGEDTQAILKNLSITKPVSTNPIRFSNVVPMDYDLAEILRRNLTSRKFEGGEIAAAGDGSSSAVQFLSTWGSEGSGNRQFNNPKGVAVDPDGNVYVADTENHRIQKFDPSGGFLWDSLTNFIRDSLTEGLVGHWKFDEGSGEEAKDSSGNGNDGTVHGGANFTVDEGRPALQFDGVDDYVTAGNAGIATGNSPRTISAWMKTRVDVSQYIAGWGPPSQNATSYLSWIGEDRYLYFIGWSNDLAGPRNMQLDGWCHVAATHDGTTSKLYVDGLEVASAAKTFNTTITDIHIGQGPTGESRFNGLISDVRIYDRALSGAEMELLFNLDQNLGGSGDANGLFNNPQDVAVDEVGNVYVADTGNHRIQKFKSDGTFDRKWGGQGDADGQFNNPSGVAVEKGGSVYVADTGNDRIQQFDSDGGHITTWGNSLAEGLVGHWKFDEDSGAIAADASGHGNDGTVQGATWTVDEGRPALQFDGVDDYVTAGNAGIPTGNSARTISAWMKANVYVIQQIVGWGPLSVNQTC